MEPAIGVFLGDPDDQAQVCLHHLLLGLMRLAPPVLHLLNYFSELADFEFGLGGERMDLVTVLLDLVLLAGDEALSAQGRHGCRWHAGRRRMRELTEERTDAGLGIGRERGRGGNRGK